MDFFWFIAGVIYVCVVLYRDDRRKKRAMDIWTQRNFNTSEQVRYRYGGDYNRAKDVVGHDFDHGSPKAWESVGREAASKQGWTWQERDIMKSDPEYCKALIGKREYEKRMKR